MQERYIHYSATPLVKIKSEQQNKNNPMPFKPHGLWFSVEGHGNGWKDWCDAEDFRKDNLKCQTEIIFSDNARILRITTPDELYAFTDEYSTSLAYISELFRRGYAIKWAEVAASYDAIIIAPYLWECRMGEGCFWYYPWDCASGCVWNAGIVKQLIPIQQEEVS